MSVAPSVSPFLVVGEPDGEWSGVSSSGALFMARRTAAPFSVRELSRRICLRAASCDEDGSADALDESPTDRPAALDAAFFEEAPEASCEPLADILDAADEEEAVLSGASSVEGRGEKGFSCGPLLPLDDAVEAEDAEDLRKGLDTERDRRWGLDMTLWRTKEERWKVHKQERGEELVIGQAGGRGEAKRPRRGSGPWLKKRPRAQTRRRDQQGGSGAGRGGEQVPVLPLYTCCITQGSSCWARDRQASHALSSSRQIYKGYTERMLGWIGL